MATKLTKEQLKEKLQGESLTTKGAKISNTTMLAAAGAAAGTTLATKIAVWTGIGFSATAGVATGLPAILGAVAVGGALATAGYGLAKLAGFGKAQDIRRKDMLKKLEEQEQLEQTEEIQKELQPLIESISPVVAIIALCKQMIYADGQEDLDEVMCMLSYFQNLSQNMSDDERDNIIALYKGIDIEQNPTEKICEYIRQNLPSEDIPKILQLLKDIMNIDGKQDTKEIAMYHKIQQLLKADSTKA